MSNLESKVTSQPKDKEQLKKEARELINEYGNDIVRVSLAFIKNKINKGDIDDLYRVYGTHLLEDFMKLKAKAHRSGRESMKVECVEKVDEHDPRTNWKTSPNYWGNKLRSALKKIKP